MRKIVSTILILCFERLSPEEMYKNIIKQRDFAISQAVVRGDFRCYMEANQWNNFTAGTCACDDLIAQGKEPCPQCKRGLCEGEDSACSIKSIDIQ